MVTLRAREPAVRPRFLPLGEAIPSRAALTELARGFLILNERDRGRAVRFAATFLREQTGAELETELSHRPHLPSARRPVSTFALGGPDPADRGGDLPPRAPDA